MHFTGMSAVTYLPDSAVFVPDAVLEPTALAVAVAAIAILIVALGLVGSLVDMHLSSRALQEANRLRAYVVDLEATRERLEQTSENLRLALDTAAAANKAKSAFLAAMSHELRTPLNAVIGFSDMLLSETFGAVGGARNKGYIKDIHSSGVHLLSLINDILDIARIDAGQCQLHEETLDPEEIVTDCLRMVTPQANAGGVELEHARAQNIPLIRADERRLKQVLVNLLGNAVKFTHAGGQVTVCLHHSVHGLTFSVRDTGIGMAENDIPVALERFGQVDSALARKYEGTGLGLPIAKHLVELHGGTLAIESALGVGTTVSVFIPATRYVERSAPLAASA
jgi:signal transduction histidine kinase